jgi:excisionase family DNA binding protein
MTESTRLIESIEDTQRVLGNSGRTKIYELIKDGHLVAVKIGRRTFVTRASIEGYVDRLATKAGELVAS